MVTVVPRPPVHLNVSTVNLTAVRVDVTIPSQHRSYADKIDLTIYGQINVDTSTRPYTPIYQVDTHISIGKL